MKRVLLVGLMMDANIGEDVYPKCLEYLMGRTYTIDFLDMCGRNIRCEKILHT